MSQTTLVSTTQPQSPTPSASGGRAYVYLCLLLMLVSLMHVPALFHPFFIDDYVYVEKTANLDVHKLFEFFRTSTLDQSASGVWWAPAGVLPFYRPIAEVSFAIDYLIWGFRPFGFHLTNLVLHLLCIVLTWKLALRMFPPMIALAAAVVFALHPVHNEAVMWVSGRFDLLVCGCALASILCYLRWRDASTAQTRWAVWAVIWFVIGLGCKETALILPAVIVFIDFLLDSRRKHRDRSWFMLLLTFGVISGLYLLLRCVLFGSIFGNLPPPYGLDKSSPMAALRQLSFNGAQYLFDMMLCIHIEPAFLPDFWRTHPTVFTAAVVVSLTLALAILVVGRSRTAIIGLLWLGLFTAPSLLSMPGERNVYLAWVGAGLIAAAACRNLMQSGSGDVALSVDSQRPLDTSRVQKWRNIFRIVMAAWLVICLIQQGLMGRVTAVSEKSYRDLMTLLPDPPFGAKIYVVHQNPLNSVGFSQAIRLHYGRPDLFGCALSVSPGIYAGPAHDRAIATGPDTIRLIRDSGNFFESFIERFYLFSTPASELATSCTRCDLKLLNPPASFDNLNTLNFQMPFPLQDPREQLFYWDNRHIDGMTDFVLYTEGARLVRCRIEESAK